MAGKHEIVEVGSTNRNGKGAVSLAESNSVATRRRLVASVKAFFRSSKKGAVLPPEPMESSAASSSSVCSSERIDRMVRSRSGFATELDFEIEASKDHWSELEPRSDYSSNDPEDEKVHLTNGEIVESLRRQFPGSGNFFRDSVGYVEVGEKIAEGTQAEIFTAKVGGSINGLLLKVFKEGPQMSDLQKQWPRGMVNRFGKGWYVYVFCSTIHFGTVVMNGRFAFLSTRRWGDLRKLMDKRMECNNNRCPPLKGGEIEKNMLHIASGMESLHQDNIIHRDLKASNVLISFYPGCRYEGDYNLDSYLCRVADFECSVGVVGTGFWRAPEILQGVKDRNITPDLFTKKSDIYSFAMTCYEMLTGRRPFEGLLLNDYEVVLRGERPVLPERTKPRIKELLSRCWHRDPVERPDFADIVRYLEDH